MLQSSEEMHKAYTKTSFRLWATNQHLYTISKHDKRVPTQDHRCDRYNQLHENWVHVFKCKASEKAFDKAIQQLRQEFSNMAIAFIMIDLLLSGITQWICNQSIGYPLDPPSYTDTIAQLHYRAFY
mmetsp:Transcript_3941/g.6186  ORF Transcript_3941/g.6186 Transcript_3941/m.6186 type:complete len:126 (-) Transcript_3941:341-718(-)